VAAGELGPEVAATEALGWIEKLNWIVEEARESSQTKPHRDTAKSSKKHKHGGGSGLDAELEMESAHALTHTGKRSPH